MALASVFKTYIYEFATTTKVAPKSLEQRFNKHQKKIFETRISIWKSSTGWSDDVIDSFIHFCYKHNPLAKPNSSAYGNMDNLAASIGYFQRWMDAHRDEIEEDGLLATIDNLVVSNDPNLFTRAMSNQDLNATYGKAWSK